MHHRHHRLDGTDVTERRTTGMSRQVIPAWRYWAVLIGLSILMGAATRSAATPWVPILCGFIGGALFSFLIHPYVRRGRNKNRDS